MYRLLLLLLLISSFALVGCGSDAADDDTPGANEPTPTDVPVEVNEALVARGIEVYRSQYCGSCHVLQVANTRGNFGPPHNGAALQAAERITAENYRGEAQNAEAYLRESIINPSVYFTPGYAATNHTMPGYGHLPEEDIEAMVYMLLQQRASEEPAE